MKYLALLILIALPFSANADISNDVAKAAAIDNSIQRLAAYDAIAEKYKLTPTSNTSAKSSGHWRIETETSAIDDSKTVYCILDATESVKIGYTTVTPTLVIRYKEGELEAYIRYHGIFLGSDDVDATIRFGKEDAQRVNWNVSTNSHAAFIQGNIGNFVNKLAETDSFIVRIEPYSESPSTSLFNPTGMSEVKAALVNAAK